MTEISSTTFVLRTYMIARTAMVSLLEMKGLEATVVVFTALCMPTSMTMVQHCNTGDPTEYKDIEETFAPEALDIITTWLKRFK